MKRLTLLLTADMLIATVTIVTILSIARYEPMLALTIICALVVAR
jgi:hypothetical protein